MFQWQQQQKTKTISGKRLKSLVLVPHRNKNTFPDLRNLCGSALLISGCLSQKLHGPSEKGLARRSFAGPATLWPHLDFGGDITPLLLLSVVLLNLPRSFWQYRRTARSFAFFSSPVEMCKVIHEKIRKASLDLEAAIWGRCNLVLAWEIKYHRQIKPQSKFIV